MIIGIILVFLIGTYFGIIPGMHIRKEGKESILTKDDSTYLKGVSAMMIFFAHSQVFVEEIGENCMILKPYSLLGGMGVMIFFFLSGYGIYNGYAERKVTFIYWKKRLINVFIPGTLISFFSVVASMVIMGNFKVSLELIKTVFINQWYIDVIMLEYIVFFVSWHISNGNKKRIVGLSIVGSFIVAILFYIAGFEPRWYNGLMLFPFGMLMAYAENKLLKIKPIMKISIMVFSSILFITTSVTFLYYKGTLMGDVFKTISGIFMAILLVIIFTYLEFGNSFTTWLGKRSLFVYLCHLNIISLIIAIIEKHGIIFMRKEIWFYILLIGAYLYIEMTYIIFKKLIFKNQGRT